MKKALLIILIILLIGAFVFSGIKVAQILINYRNIDALYDKAANEFVKKASVPAPENGEIKVIDPEEKNPENAEKASADKPSVGTDDSKMLEEKIIPEYAPIEIDFDALKKINKEIVAWIYCEDSRINYPVLHNLVSNFYYIAHAYDRSKSSAGAIFIDYRNATGFADYNTIIYGHHTNNGAMFYTLDNWKKQDFFDEHPVMYILTPEKDYKVVLFSVYTVSASSEAYALISGPGEDLTEYIKVTKERSIVKADVELDPEAKYVMLSTCSKEFASARTVLHGMLVPLDSAAGVPVN